jgi:ABC-type multidrug transport system ATPase subunit
MVGPKILILDEPLAGCDPESQKAISDLLIDLSKQEGKAVLFSSHDLRMVRSVAKKILRADGGRVGWEEGAVADHPW